MELIGGFLIMQQKYHYAVLEILPAAWPPAVRLESRLQSCIPEQCRVQEHIRELICVLGAWSLTPLGCTL